MEVSERAELPRDNEQPELLQQVPIMIEPAMEKRPCAICQQTVVPQIQILQKYSN